MVELHYREWRRSREKEKEKERWWKSKREVGVKNKKVVMKTYDYYFILKTRIITLLAHNCLMYLLI